MAVVVVAFSSVINKAEDRKSASDEDLKKVYSSFVSGDEKAELDTFSRVDPSQLKPLVTKDLKSKDKLALLRSTSVAWVGRVPGLQKELLKLLDSDLSEGVAHEYLLEMPEKGNSSGLVDWWIKAGKTKNTYFGPNRGFARYLEPKALQTLYALYQKKGSLDEKQDRWVFELICRQLQRTCKDRDALAKDWPTAKKRFDADYDKWSSDPLRDAQYEVASRFGSFAYRSIARDQQVFLSPDGKVLLVLAEDSSGLNAHGFDTSSGKQLYEHELADYEILNVVGPTLSGSMVQVQKGSQHQLIDVVTGEVRFSFASPAESEGSPLYVLGDDSTCLTYTNLSKAKQLEFLTINAKTGEVSKRSPVKNPTGWLRLIKPVISPDGAKLRATADAGGGDSTEVEFDIATGAFQPAAQLKTLTSNWLIHDWSAVNGPGENRWLETALLYGGTGHVMSTNSQYGVSLWESGRIGITNTSHSRLLCQIMPDYNAVPDKILYARCNDDASVVVAVLTDGGKTDASLAKLRFVTFKRKVK